MFYAGVADLVVPLRAQYIAAARLLAQRGIKAGLIHLDASRDYDKVLRDAEAYWQLLEPGGYLVGDDYGASWPGVIKAADEFAAKVGLQLEIVPPKWLLRKPALAPDRPEAQPAINSREYREALLSIIERQTHVPAAELMLAFESLGVNCEFGIVQRYCGAEPLGLLRFSSTSLDKLLHGLDRRFEGIDVPGNITVKLMGAGRQEFIADEQTYGFFYHTWQFEGDIEPSELAALEGKTGFSQKKAAGGPGSRQ